MRSNEKEHRYIHQGLSVYRYPTSIEPSKDEVRGRIEPKYLDIFSNWIKDLKPDIVHFHSRTRGCSFYHARTIRQLGIPMVLTIHAADFMCVAGTARLWGVSPCDGRIDEFRCTACWLKKQGVPLWWLAWLLSRMPDAFIRRLGGMGGKLGTLFSLRKIFLERREREETLFSYFSYIIVVAKWLYSILKINNIQEGKLYYCRHGISKDFSYRKNESKSYAKDKIRVGYVGRFNSVKGIHVLIKAVKKLPKSIGIELKIYGRINFKEDEDYFKQLISFSHGDPRIEFCGELTEENYAKVMSGFDLVAVPSIWLETGPYIVLEAFLAGIPVIGSNLGGIAELVTHNLNGMLLESGNVRAWSGALKWIYNHRDILNTWAHNIPSVRSSKEVAEEMNSLYMDVLAKAGKTTV